MNAERVNGILFVVWFATVMVNGLNQKRSVRCLGFNLAMQDAIVIAALMD